MEKPFVGYTTLDVVENRILYHSYSTIDTILSYRLSVKKKIIMAIRPSPMN